MHPGRGLSLRAWFIDAFGPSEVADHHHGLEGRSEDVHAQRAAGRAGTGQTRAVNAGRGLDVRRGLVRNGYDGRAQ